MALAGNVVWWLTLGPVISLFWLVAGCLMCITIVGIPFGRAAFTIAKLNLSPFGKDVVSTSELRKARATLADDVSLQHEHMAISAISFVAKILWFPLGLVLAVIHCLRGAVLFVLVLTIPLGLQDFKIAGLSLFPIRKRVVTSEMATKIRAALADRALARV